MKNVIFLFPGQGSQSKQMLNPIRNYHIKKAMDVFENASEICGFNIVNLIEKAPAEVLNRVEYTPILIYATSMAYLKIMEEHEIVPSAVAGHSIGEYAALTVAGVLDFSDACKLINIRAKLMSEVEERGGLCAVKSNEIDYSLIQKICNEVSDECDFVTPALYNSPKQLVVGGSVASVDKFCERLKLEKAYFTKRVAVGQAFHTKIMYSMSEKFRKYVNGIKIQECKIPIILNCTGCYYNETNNGNDLRDELVSQCYLPVQWEKTMKCFLELENTSFIEVGPGHSLTGMMKDYGTGIRCICTEDRKAMEKERKKYVAAI